MAETQKILIAEDELLLLSNLLSAARDAGYEAGGASDGIAALELLSKNHYDLLVTDIRMPHIDGIELIGRTRKICPSTRFVVITGYASVEYAVSCLRHGASDFLIKPFDQSDFIDSVSHALEIRNDKADDNEIESEPGHSLTSRETEVLKWCKEGKSYWEIATILKVSTATVKFHLANIFKKLSASNKTQAVAKAIELGLLN